MWNQHLTNVIEWFLKITFVHSDTSEFIKAEPDELSRILRYFDTGIESVELVEVPNKLQELIHELEKDKPNTNNLIHIFNNAKYMKNGTEIATTVDKQNGSKIFIISSDSECRAYKLLFHHKGMSKPLEFFNESDGTLRLLDFHKMLFSDEEDDLFIIDELDRKLHPLASQELIKLFNSKSQRRQQLIFTTHESSLLSSDFLRDDEVRFIVKGSDNVATMNSVIGHNEFIYAISENDYLNGEYDKIFSRWRSSE